jgi:hypothetical protein
LERQTSLIIAEALAVIGLVSAIVQFVDFENKVVGRLNEFRQSVNEAPKTFRKVNRQLPLLIDTLRRTQNQADSGHVSEETATALKPVVEGCLANVKQLEDMLAKALPSEKDSTWSRTNYGGREHNRYERTSQRLVSRQHRSHDSSLPGARS